MKKNTIIDNYMFGTMRYNKSEGKRHYRSRERERRWSDLGIITDQEKDKEDKYLDLASQMYSCIRRDKRINTMMEHLKREKSNVPLSVLKKVAKKYKIRIKRMTSMFRISSEKTDLYEDMVKDITSHMRDYRIDSISS